MIKMDKRRFLKTYGITVVILTAIFFVLYFRFIDGTYIYAYKDIGSDTCEQYLPRMIFDVNNIISKNFRIYTLQRGLGAYYLNSLYTYLNPVNLPLLIFGEANIHWGLLLSLYLKYLCIAFFHFRFLGDYSKMIVLQLSVHFYGHFAVIMFFGGSTMLF